MTQPAQVSTTNPSDRSPGLATAGALVLVAAAVAWHVLQLLDWSVRSPFDFDAKTFYIPYARRLLDEGWSFLFSPAAIQVPPVSFMFPAIFGADLAVQKQVGILLSALVVVLLFRTGWLLHSRRAGVFAALLFACSPIPLPYMSTGSVEPTFVFLLTTWAWGMAEGASGRRWGFWVAGIAVGLASLTRATLLYYLPLVIAGSLLAARLQPTSRTAWRGMLLTHTLGFAMVAPLLLRNIVAFGLPAISTGAGVALYNGHHVLTWGFDPGYFALTFDFGILGRQGAGHLDLDTDRVLVGAAKRVVASFDLLFLAKLYAIKLASFVFVSNVEWIAPVAELRTWRVVLFCLSLASLPGLLARPALLVMAGGAAVQVAAHLPVLYAHRYSVVALDVPLALLAGIGLMTAWQDWSARAKVTGLALMASATLGGVVVADTARLLQPNVENTPHVTVFERGRGALQMTAGAGAALIGDGRIRTNAGIAELDIDLRGEPIEAGRNYVLAIDGSLDVPANRPASCVVIYLYSVAGEPFVRERALATSWNTNGRPQRMLNGVNEQIKMHAPGLLRLQFHCGAGATIDISRIAVVQPFFSFDVLRNHFSGRGVLKPE